MKLDKYLADKGITQVEFAKKLGTFQQNVSDWVKGNTKPLPATIQKISAATGGAVGFEDFYPPAKKKKRRSA